jgi:hypothetical protein
MMAVDGGDQGLWQPEELEAMLQHQLSAPLEFDFSYLGREATRRLDVLGSSQGPPIATFHDLLHHRSPPVKLLEITKEFAKACRTRSDRLLPNEIAAMLYLLSIVVARTRCGRRITKLEDDALRHSLDWALKQPWVDESTRELLREGDRVIGGRETESDG